MSPSDAAWQQLISALHASGRKAALAITGGGSGAVGELLRVPGGSRLLLDAQIPYDALALAAFLGFAPAQACSSDTAIAMAQSARARAARLAPAGADLVGLGADTAERLVAPKYYGDDELRMHVALEEIANSGSSFLVAVRIDAAGRVRALNDIPVPRRYADLFTEIPEHRFRLDISSSELRARRRAVNL